MSSGNCSPLVPVFHLGKDDIAVIRTLLRPYEAYVRNRVRPSFQRAMLLIGIETLSQRIARALTCSEGSLNLTVIEIEIISKALELCIEQLPRYISKSHQRDEVLESCKKLKKEFDRAFTTKPYFSFNP